MPALSTAFCKVMSLPLACPAASVFCVDSLYSAYQEAPSYHLIATLGNNYIKRMFPKLDRIVSARIK